MRTFSRKPGLLQAKFAGSTKPSPSLSAHNRTERSTLHSRFAIGNQTQPSIHQGKEGADTKGAIAAELSGSSHNTALLPINTGHPQAAPTDGATGGMPLPAAVRTPFENDLNADFSRVRLFPDRPDITGPLGARAVTRGQDIYFHPGQFRPGTAGGDRLIAHELAHTLQTRVADQPANSGSNPVSRPGDALERNADAIARGDAVSVLPAPAGMMLRSPFDNETAEERGRREHLLQSISNAMNTILRLLRTGGLVSGIETATDRNGVQGVLYYAGSGSEVFESYSDRGTRLRRMVRSLMAMATQYRSAPIPATFGPPVPEPASSSGRYESSPFTYTHDGQTITSTYGGATAEWADLQAAYERYCVSQGQIGGVFEQDWLFLDPNLQIVPGALRGAPRLSRGVPSGAYMVVPDIEHEPLRYWRLTGYEDAPPRGSVIIELWHDDFGYYYMHRGQRIDVPSPW